MSLPSLHLISYPPKVSTARSSSRVLPSITTAREKRGDGEGGSRRIRTCSFPDGLSRVPPHLMWWYCFLTPPPDRLSFDGRVFCMRVPSSFRRPTPPHSQNFSSFFGWTASWDSDGEVSTETPVLRSRAVPWLEPTACSRDAMVHGFSEEWSFVKDIRRPQAVLPTSPSLRAGLSSTVPHCREPWFGHSTPLVPDRAGSGSDRGGVEGSGVQGEGQSRHITSFVPLCQDDMWQPRALQTCQVRTKRGHPCDLLTG